MISLSKINSVTPKISLGKSSSKPKEEVNKSETKSSSLNFMPQYRYNLKTAFNECYQTLNEFKEDYYPVKSATYLCELIKQAKRCGDDELVSKLEEERLIVSRNIKKMRKEVYNSAQTKEEHLTALKNYIKENGSYMNCAECADLMLEKLHKKGIKADNVFLYTVNNEGNRVNYAEHVFTVAGIDEKADINRPETWGQNAVIVDGWAGICMRAADGIEYYKDFFKTNPDKHKLNFEYN